MSQIHSKIDAAVEADPGSLFEAGLNDEIEETELESDLLMALPGLDTVRVRGEQVGDLLTVQIDGSNSIESVYSLGEAGAAEGFHFNTTETASWTTEFSFHFSIEHPSSQFLLLDPQLNVTAALREVVSLAAENAPSAALSDADLNLSVRLGRLDGPDHTIALTVAGSPLMSADSVPELIGVLNESLTAAGQDSVEFYDAGDLVGVRATSGQWTEMSLFGASRLGFDEAPSAIGSVNTPVEIGLLPAAIENGVAAFDVSIPVHFQNQSGGSEFTIDELTLTSNGGTTSIEDLLRLEPTGTSSVTLPVTSAASIPDGGAAIVQTPAPIFTESTPLFSLQTLDEEPVFDFGFGDLIGDGLDGLTALVESLEASPVFTTEIPVLNTTLADEVDLGARLRESVIEPIKAYLVSNPTASSEDLLSEILDFIPITSASSLKTPGKLKFSLAFDTTATASLGADFGLDAAELPLSVDGAIDLDLKVDADFEILFGVDLTKMPSLEEAFFFQIKELDLDAMLLAPGEGTATATVEGRIGFATVNASIEPTDENLPLVDVGVLITPEDETSTLTLGQIGDLPLSEIIAVSGDPLLNLLPTGQVGAQLAFNAKIGDFDTAILGKPAVTVTANPLFDG
ncbi:MAG: hypothetical protein AAFU85_33650, partial [Planctomycetota bacterium]